MMTINEKKALNAERSKAVREAWKHERELVREGKGTRQWTVEEQKEMLEADHVAGYYGHHMKSCATYREYADNPKNIQFLTREEHIYGAHQGLTRNQTNGYYNYKTHSMENFEKNSLREAPVEELDEKYCEGFGQSQDNSYDNGYGENEDYSEGIDYSESNFRDESEDIDYTEEESEGNAY